MTTIKNIAIIDNLINNLYKKIDVLSNNLNCDEIYSNKRILKLAYDANKLFEEKQNLKSINIK
jgi:hypothetical protein